MSQPLFKRRTAIILVLLAVLSMGAALGIILFADDDVVSTGSDTFSVSALGHKALVDVLEEVDIPVLISRYETAHRADEASLVIAAEPFIDGEQDADNLRKLARATDTPVLIVLPKRQGVPSWENNRWVETVEDVDPDRIDAVLDAIALHSGVLRPSTGDEQVDWTMNEGFDWHTSDWTQPVIGSPQVLPPGDLVPLIDSPEGVLLAEHTFALVDDEQGDEIEESVFVLSDPDIFATHGISKANNARLAVEIIDELRDGDGAVIFDEVLHGYEQRPSLASKLLEFPLVLATIQVGLLFLLWLWAGLGRFGSPRPIDRSIGAGSEFFIDNTAKILRFGGYSGYMLEKYMWLSYRDVAQAMHAPSSMSNRELLDWLVERTRTRNVSAPLRKWAEHCEDLAINSQSTSAYEAVKIARRIYHWKSEMIHGFGHD